MEASMNGIGINLGAMSVWPDRKELPSVLSACPALPMELLPEALVPWVEDLAANLGVLPEFIAIPALGFLAITLGCKVGIRPKQFDTGWLVVGTVLWVALIASSGRKKSPSINAAQEPLARIESKASEAYNEKMRETRAERAAVDAKIDGVKSKIKDLAKTRVNSDVEEEELARLLSRQDELKVTQKRYTTHDATIEKFGMLLTENTNGMGLVADELSGWMRGLERSGHEASRAFYLKGWGGTAPDIVDRVGRGTTYVKLLSIIIVGGIQPEVFYEHVAEVLKGGRDADGLLARFQLAVIPDPSQKLPHVDKCPDFAARDLVHAIFGRLDELTPDQLGLRQERDEIPAVQFDEAGQHVFNDYLEDLEGKLLKSDIVPALHSHLAKYRSTMPALALLCELVDWAAIEPGEDEESGSGTLRVGLGAATRAASLCDWLEIHARAIYGSVVNGELKAAHALAKKVTAGAVPDGSTLRQIQRKGWSGLTDKSLVQAAVEILEDHNWLRVVDEKPTTGRTSQRVLLHPDFQIQRPDADKTDKRGSVSFVSQL